MADGSIVGHERVRALLARSIQAGRLPPALLLAGPEGVGKRTVALAAARALVCETGQGVACDQCSACSRAARGLHPDVIVVEPETATIKIEQVRDMAREVLALPFEGRARGFVMDDAHVMTEQASNALAFYEARGFVRTGRSETDPRGRPYPLIHLRHAGV